MQIIVDIPKEYYEELQQEDLILDPTIRIFKNGIPLSENHEELRISKKSACKYCKFINEDMPLEKDRDREVTEIRYSTNNNSLFYWGHHYRVPLNFCPNCGARLQRGDKDANSD